jgi:hypothetical protein
MLTAVLKAVKMLLFCCPNKAVQDAVLTARKAVQDVVLTALKAVQDADYFPVCVDIVFLFVGSIN